MSAFVIVPRSIWLFFKLKKKKTADERKKSGAFYFDLVWNAIETSFLLVCYRMLFVFLWKCLLNTAKQRTRFYNVFFFCLLLLLPIYWQLSNSVGKNKCRCSMAEWLLCLQYHIGQHTQTFFTTDVRLIILLSLWSTNLYDRHKKNTHQSMLKIHKKRLKMKSPL